MTCAIEDVGFEIRDCIQWIYGSGFPKSLDVSKALDKQAGATREVVGSKHGANLLKSNAFADRAINGHNPNVAITAPATPEAQQWHGFGTALKPANEPAVLARKPLSGTVADNVLTWGCGALNIDGCRVEYDGKPPTGSGSDNNLVYGHRKGNGGNETSPLGRWPANVIFDEEAAQMLDAQSGERHGGGHARHSTGTPSVAKGKEYARVSHGHSDSGGASRFFYVAKASRAEREAGLDGMEVQRRAGLQGSDRDGEIDPLSERWRTSPRANHHPTVKPITLMRYLVRLVTPPGGVVLDPFMGSGSTGCAAMLEAMQFIGIELSAEYLEIARRRILHHANQNPMGL
jgi:site-specific DNA-methyltransferase (adenine-specific)